MYLYIKNAHIFFALTSLCLLVVRFVWAFNASPQRHYKWVNIFPHVNDTLLLSCAIYLMVISRQYPLATEWLTVKLIAILIYIGFASMAIKRGKTPRVKLIFFVLAIVTFLYIFTVARQHSAVF